MKNYISIEPVRTLSALLAFGAAVILLLAFTLDWGGDVTGLVNAVWVAFIALIGSFFVRAKVQPVDTP
jgi:hypothetical protein